MNEHGETGRPHSPEIERKVVFIGGPLDGASHWEPKALVPSGVYYPSPDSDRPGAGVSVGGHLPVDRDRGHYRYEPGCAADGTMSMRWFAPGQWTGPGWTCAWHDQSGDGPGGCPQCAYERHGDDD